MAWLGKRRVGSIGGFTGSSGDRPQAVMKGKRPKRPGVAVMAVAWVEAEAAGWLWWRQTQAKLKKLRGDKRLRGRQSRLCSLARGCTMVVGLVAVRLLAPPKSRWVFAGVPQVVVRPGGEFAPNRACSGHGFAVGSPWWLVGRSSVACCGGWTATPCR